MRLSMFCVYNILGFLPSRSRLLLLSPFLFCFSIYWIINASCRCVQPLPHPCAPNEIMLFVYIIGLCVCVCGLQLVRWWRFCVGRCILCCATKECGMPTKFLSMMQRRFKMLINNSIGSTMGCIRCCRHMENKKQKGSRTWRTESSRLECLAVCVWVCACSVSESIEKYIYERNNKISATPATADEPSSNGAPLQPCHIFYTSFFSQLFIYLCWCELFAGFFSSLFANIHSFCRNFTHVHKSYKNVVKFLQTSHSRSFG